MLAARAPGKVNLSLLVGRPRGDGLHPLVSVVQPVSLADELTLEPAGGPGARGRVDAAGAPPAVPGPHGDEVVCPGVEGPNLAARALALFREATGWDAPPQRLTITKRVPVAAGMGGGSGDAAAALRLAAHAAGGAPPGLLHELAFQLGADVPSQVEPGRVLMHGAGEHVEPLPAAPPFALLVVRSEATLPTPAVYRTFDELGGGRGPEELARAAQAAREGEPPPPVNDLQAAAIHLRPEIADTLAAVRAAGAVSALVSGSGPTVFGLFATREAAAAAAGRMGGEVAEPVGADFARVRPA